MQPATIHSSDPSFSWPASTDGEYARRYLQPLLKSGTTHFVANAPAEMHVVRCGELVFPVTKAGWEPGMSYVVSPQAHYVDYTAEEITRLPSLALRLGAGAIFGLLRRLLGNGLCSAVQVNNWLVSTNLYPAGSAETAGPLLEFLRERHPEQPIIFRSVDLRANRPLAEALVRRGARMLISRVVYYQDATATAFWRQRQISVDRTRWTKSGLHLRRLTFPEDAPLIPRIHELYGALYLRKYSALNPDLTPAFLQTALDANLLEIHGLFRKEDFVGVLGFFTRNGIMTQPLFGFDTTLPLELRLYVHLSLAVLEIARQRGLLVNASAGVGAFKKLRGGEATVEYNAVFDDHLPPRQRQAWSVLQRMLRPVAESIMLRYEL